ncbi:AraC-like DNA-binding protein [Chitinophaga dinghuensis]|uniref:AraC-like DNA-binding protein n=1 Tax=Chitinophaga dinghuensis TaxID=1539050 RepID=A0A327VPS2_9BACT|nr:AraC family transcriptional regulator [Chitinophaga dinghuensis]RAJ77335.1 AraC-like DNA-binding protein [Chitinophaga dinghuensis]
MIPVHSITGALEIRKLSGINPDSIHRRLAHRDEHYQFVIQESGSTVMSVDFKTVPLKAGHVLCILPGQVHRAQSARHSHVWIIAVKREWIHETYRFVLDTFAPNHGAVALDKAMLPALHHSITLLHDMYISGDEIRFLPQVLRGATDVCIGICTGAYHRQHTEDDLILSRPVQLLHEFRQLLARHYLTMKSPAAYADKLHISLSYLNEVVKEQTGYSVSRLIQEQVITESRRILYYTDISIKELATRMGYDDYSYFCRYFKNATGMTPAQARKFSRE